MVFPPGPKGRHTTFRFFGQDVIPEEKHNVRPHKKDQNVTAEPGQHVNLTCTVPDSKSVIVIVWRRANVTEEYVLLYRDKGLDPSLQEPSFKNRVDLRDRQMKDGDVSLVLKNVTTNDTGIYECRVQHQGNRERKRICSINLNVSPPGNNSDGGNRTQSVGLIVGLLVLSFIVAVAAILIIKRTACLMQKRSAADSPKEEAV